MSAKAYADPGLIATWLADREGKTQAGRRALNELTKRNLGLVQYWVKKIRVPEEEREDFFAAGQLGLVQGFIHFDPERGALANCLGYWIKCYLYQFLLKMNPQAKDTKGYRRAFFHHRRARARLLQRLHRDPSSEEIAQEIGGGVTKEDVESVLVSSVTLKVGFWSEWQVTAEMEEGFLTILSGGLYQSNVEDLIAEVDLQTKRRLALRDELSRLKPKEKKLIERRYLKPKEQEKSMSLLGLGTRQNASLIDQSARRKLREALSKREDLK